MSIKVHLLIILFLSTTLSDDWNYSADIAELKTLTKVQLFDFAEKQNLKVKKSGTKAQVINEIHSQLR